MVFLLISRIALPQTLPVFDVSMKSVKEIPLPPGYERIQVPEASFADYLRNLPLRKDNTVYLYSKQPKLNQRAHYAVIDISTGEKDLQQCADALMRLRAEYFYGKKMYDSIRFLKNDRSFYTFQGFISYRNFPDRGIFMRFMETVFIHCGTQTLYRQLKAVPDFSAIQIGDVLIKPGAPGHAEIVMDMAVHQQTGNKIFLLLQGYMPAQDMHILMNPYSPVSPWYPIPRSKLLITASWQFTADQLRRW